MIKIITRPLKYFSCFVYKYYFTGRDADAYKMNSYSLSYSFIIHKELRIRLGQVTVYVPPPPVRVELTLAVVRNMDLKKRKYHGT